MGGGGGGGGFGGAEAAAKNKAGRWAAALHKVSGRLVEKSVDGILTFASWASELLLLLLLGFYFLVLL